MQHPRFSFWCAWSPFFPRVASLTLLKAGAEFGEWIKKGNRNLHSKRTINGKIFKSGKPQKVRSLVLLSLSQICDFWIDAYVKISLPLHFAVLRFASDLHLWTFWFFLLPFSANMLARKDGWSFCKIVSFQRHLCTLFLQKTTKTSLKPTTKAVW